MKGMWRVALESYASKGLWPDRLSSTGIVKQLVVSGNDAQIPSLLLHRNMKGFSQEVKDTLITRAVPHMPAKDALVAAQTHNRSSSVATVLLARVLKNDVDHHERIELAKKIHDWKKGTEISHPTTIVSNCQADNRYTALMTRVALKDKSCRKELIEVLPQRSQKLLATLSALKTARRGNRESATTEVLASLSKIPENAFLLQSVLPKVGMSGGWTDALKFLEEFHPKLLCGPHAVEPYLLAGRWEPALALVTDLSKQERRGKYAPTSIFWRCLGKLARVDTGSPLVKALVAGWSSEGGSRKSRDVPSILLPSDPKESLACCNELILASATGWKSALKVFRHSKDYKALSLFGLTTSSLTLGVKHFSRSSKARERLISLLIDGGKLNLLIDALASRVGVEMDEVSSVLAACGGLNVAPEGYARFVKKLRRLDDVNGMLFVLEAAYFALVEYKENNSDKNYHLGVELLFEDTLQKAYSFLMKHRSTSTPRFCALLGQMKRRGIPFTEEMKVKFSSLGRHDDEGGHPQFMRLNGITEDDLLPSLSDPTFCQSKVQTLRRMLARNVGDDKALSELRKGLVAVSLVGFQSQKKDSIDVKEVVRSCNGFKTFVAAGESALREDDEDSLFVAIAILVCVSNNAVYTHQQKLMEDIRRALASKARERLLLASTQSILRTLLRWNLRRLQQPSTLVLRRAVSGWRRELSLIRRRMLREVSHTLFTKSGNCQPALAFHQDVLGRSPEAVRQIALSLLANSSLPTVDECERLTIAMKALKQGNLSDGTTELLVKEIRRRTDADASFPGDQVLLPGKDFSEEASIIFGAMSELFLSLECPTYIRTESSTTPSHTQRALLQRQAVALQRLLNSDLCPRPLSLLMCRGLALLPTPESHFLLQSIFLHHLDGPEIVSVVKARSPENARWNIQLAYEARKVPLKS